MKKMICIAVIFLLVCPAGAWAEETFFFAIDAQHIYPGMEMSYAQGYVPTIENNIVHVVMPIVLKGTASCENITAGIDLGEQEQSSFIFKNYANTFLWQRYEFEDGRVLCYLVRFDLELNGDRVNGSYPILINVEGVTKGGERVAQQFPLYIVIRDGKEWVDPEKTVSQPKLMVESYTCEPESLQAGEDGIVSIVVKNTSQTQPVQNIKLAVQDTGERILPISTGAVYIPKIGKGESVLCDFTVRVTALATVGPHEVHITMEYEDVQAAPMMAADTIVVDVEQPIRLKYEQPSLPGKVTEGDNVAFSMNLMNMGKGTVYNALVTFKIPGLNNGGCVLVGNIEPGKSAPAKTNLLVSAMDGRYKETAGKIILSYENEAGEVFTQEMDVNTFIEEKIDVIPVVGEEDVKSPVVPWWGILIAAIVLLGVIGIITEKTVKAQKERKADELRL